MANIAEFISEKIDEHYISKQKRYPAHTNWASNLGHPCLRFLVHARLDWDKKDLPGLFLQRIFDEGRLHEDAILKLFQEIGIKIIRSQEPFNWQEYQISGRIDGAIKFDNITYPIEIKSMSPYIFETVNSIEDMKNHSKHYIRGYITQMAIYQLHTNSETGLFFLKNKTSGEIKTLSCPLDYALAEEALKKAEMVNEYVEKGEYPEQIIYDPDICDDCWFRTVCLPIKKAMNEAQISTDNHFIELVNKKEQLKPTFAEYNKIDKEIKGILNAQENKNIFAGDWLITGKEVNRKGYTVSDTIYTQWKFKKLTKEE